jgi:RHS repeat-associated protein
LSISATNSSGITKFVYDGADVVRDLDGSGSTIADYLNGPGIDNKIRQTSGGASSYFVTDHLGTTRALTDASGNVTSSLSYDSFGNINSGSVPTRYTYTGREADADTGLLYYRARWYEPKEGRFISEDPIGLSGGINLYAYVRNNPQRWQDPMGEDILGIAFGGSGFAGYGGMGSAVGGSGSTLYGYNSADGTVGTTSSYGYFYPGGCKNHRGMAIGSSAGIGPSAVWSNDACAALRFRVRI